MILFEQFSYYDVDSFLSWVWGGCCPWTVMFVFYNLLKVFSVSYFPSPSLWPVMQAERGTLVVHSRYTEMYTLITLITTLRTTLGQVRTVNTSAFSVLTRHSDLCDQFAILGWPCSKIWPLENTSHIIYNRHKDKTWWRQLPQTTNLQTVNWVWKVSARVN